MILNEHSLIPRRLFVQLATDMGNGKLRTRLINGILVEQAAKMTSRSVAIVAYIAASAVCACFEGCSPMENDVPKAASPTRLSSPERLAETFSKAYNEGDRDRLLALMKWDGVPPRIREFFEEMMTRFIDRNQVIGWKTSPYIAEEMQDLMYFDGKPIEANLHPEVWIRFETSWQQGANQVNWDIKLAAGQDANGNWRFCGAVWKK